MNATEPLQTDLHDRLIRISTNTIAGMLIQMGGMMTRTIEQVRPLGTFPRFVGPAFTVRCVPVREDLRTSASMANPGNPHYGTFDTIPTGSVVVYGTAGDARSGSLGDVLASVLKTRGVAGLVTDGAVRDGEAIAGIGLPVFCAGVAPPPIGRSLYTAGIQEIIGCGGVMVCPGDIVVGDADGVVVIPRHLAGDIAAKGVEKEEIEAWVRTRIDRGEPQKGLYPPDDKVIAEYRRWRDAGSKK